MTREFTKVGVVGLGTMGAGIVEVFARHGIEVVAVERDDDALQHGVGHLEASTSRAVKRGKLADDEKQAIFERITFSTSMNDLADCHLVVEAVPEKLELKQQIFTELDRITSPDAILATNTSSLSVTEISVATHRPAQVVGLHFFNPAPVLKLVEVIRTVVTDVEVIDDIKVLAEKLGKVPVVVGDKAGFIANALLFGYLNHAASMYDQRYATREDIDAAMKFGCGLPMGPLALLDLIGLDTAYEILDTMYKQTRDRLHAPSPIIKQMVMAGMKGRKTGRGFYTYETADSPVVVADENGAATTVDEQVRPVQRVGVIGSGTMAIGIAEVFAKAEFDVVLRARGKEQIDKAKAAIHRSLEKAVVRGKLSEADRDAALARIIGSTSFDDLTDCDLIVEATVEELTVKQAIFATLDEVAKPGAILATTTSSLPVVEIAAATGRMHDVAGMHFFNPAPVMKLVEVVKTVNTGEEVAATLRAVCERLGKHAVTCGDRAGFIVNALLFPYLNDSVRMLEAHYATADDIDSAMKVGCGYPMGPFELLDVVGLDVALAIQRTLYLEFREP
ncbi:MAG TPA: 3-hydroxybutyryl-CoA dehydrogenase, partial [Actinomycetes bacterium]|nr:3-hydroxybutyryl-CoA dehydrogenase [Actinomycetes bacterium]